MKSTYYSVLIGLLFLPLLTSCFFGFDKKPTSYSPDLSDPNMVEYTTIGKNQGSAYLNGDEVWLLTEEFNPVVELVADSVSLALWLNGENFPLRFTFQAPLLEGFLSNPTSIIGDYEVGETSSAEIITFGNTAISEENIQSETATSGKLFLLHAERTSRGIILSGTFSLQTTSFSLTYGRFDVLLRPQDILIR